MAKKIPIVALDDSGAVVQRFDSIAAAHDTRWNAGGIWQSMRGQALGLGTLYKGLAWRCAADVEPPPPPPPAPELPNPLAAFVADNLHDAPGHLIAFAEFYGRFIAWLPKGKRPEWSRIRVSKDLRPLKFRTGKGAANKVFLINAAWQPCEAGQAYVINTEGQIRREL